MLINRNAQQQQQQKEEVDDYDYIQRKSTAISVLRKGIKRLREGLQVPNTRSLYATTTTTTSSSSNIGTFTTQQDASSQELKSSSSSSLSLQQYHLLGKVAQVELALVDFQAYCNNDKD
mmetsp:Transcript_15973/g.15778  ORF Transcript_15973/g.15778 Transcript_15973/m.15778 type:complete len:119 (+) Transcript_15973:176-532(+)